MAIHAHSLGVIHIRVAGTNRGQGPCHSFVVRCLCRQHTSSTSAVHQHSSTSMASNMCAADMVQQGSVWCSDRARHRNNGHVNHGRLRQSNGVSSHSLPWLFSCPQPSCAAYHARAELDARSCDSHMYGTHATRQTRTTQAHIAPPRAHNAPCTISNAQNVKHQSGTRNRSVSQRTASDVISASTAFQVTGEMRPTMPKSRNPTRPSPSTSRLPA